MSKVNVPYKTIVLLNLLPYREQIKKEKQQQFGILAGLSAMVGLLMIGMASTIVSSMTTNQESRNRFVEAETSKLKEQIKEIEELKTTIKEVLARKQVVEGLQSNRSDVVNLMNELVAHLPNNVYLKSLEQKGNLIKMVGYCYNNEDVATYMRNLDATKLLKEPAIVEIKSTPLSGTLLGAKTKTKVKGEVEEKVSEFSMEIKYENRLSEEEQILAMSAGSEKDKKDAKNNKKAKKDKTAKAKE